MRMARELAGPPALCENETFSPQMRSFARRKFEGTSQIEVSSKLVTTAAVHVPGSAVPTHWDPKYLDRRLERDVVAHMDSAII